MDMGIFQHLGEVFGQFQTTASQISSMVNVSPRGEGWNVSVSLPEKIEFTRTQLFWLWGVLHVVWGLGVHWISLAQIKRYNDSLPVNSEERISGTEKLGMFVGRVGWGLEWKIIQFALVFVLSTILFRVVGPIATYTVSPLVFGNTSDVRNAFVALKDSMNRNDLLSVAWVMSPRDIKISQL